MKLIDRTKACALNHRTRIFTRSPREKYAWKLVESATALAKLGGAKRVETVVSSSNLLMAKSRPEQALGLIESVVPLIAQRSAEPGRDFTKFIKVIEQFGLQSRHPERVAGIVAQMLHALRERGMHGGVLGLAGAQGTLLFGSSSPMSNSIVREAISTVEESIRDYRTANPVANIRDFEFQSVGKFTALLAEHGFVGEAADMVLAVPGSLRDMHDGHLAVHFAIEKFAAMEGLNEGHWKQLAYFVRSSSIESDSMGLGCLGAFSVQAAQAGFGSVADETLAYVRKNISAALERHTARADKLSAIESELRLMGVGTPLSG